MFRLAIFFLVLVGCGRSVDAPSFPVRALGTDHVVHGSDTPTTAHESPSRRVQYQSRQQLRDLRHLEELLIAGRLDEASALSSFLEPHASMRPDPRAGDAAIELEHATTIEQACAVAARISAGCGGCHRRTGVRVPFEEGPPPPVGDQTRCSPRHRWAIGQLSDGVSSGLDQPWRAGLDAFTSTALTGPGSPAAPRVKDIVRPALASVGTDTLEARAKTFGELLATCSGCHQSARVSRR